MAIPRKTDDELRDDDDRPKTEALRKAAGRGYGDRNDGFARSQFSQSKRKRSRISKVGKPKRGGKR